MHGRDQRPSRDVPGDRKPTAGTTIDADDVHGCSFPSRRASFEATDGTVIAVRFCIICDSCSAMLWRAAACEATQEPSARIDLTAPMSMKGGCRSAILRLERVKGVQE